MDKRRRMLVPAVVALGAILAIELSVAALSARTPPRPAAAAPSGSALDTPLGRLPLIDDRGRPTSLAAYRGRYLVLAPSLTLCHEVCPLTIGALTVLRRELAGRGLGRRVAIAQATVDPWRDSPARIRAFRRLTGSDIPFLTGTRAQIRRLWSALGVTYRRVPQERPADRDWWTGRPERFDVMHTSGVFVIDPDGHVRAAFLGTPALSGSLPRRLAALLNDEGRENLRHPQAPWTPAQVLAAVTRLAGAAARPTAAGRPVRTGGALQRRLEALRGRPVVVNEWASWCPPCRREIPLLTAAAARHRDRLGFVGLNVRDSPAAARRFLASHPLNYPSYADPDGSAAASLGRSVGVPTTVFLDPAGRVAGVHMGEYADAAELEQDIRRYAPAGPG